MVLLLVNYWASAQNQKVNEFSAQQAVEYAMKNAVQVRNAILDLKIQKQVNISDVSV